MPKMAENDETPSANFLPTPAVVLRWIAAAGDAAWGPSRYAREHAVPRDALDGPLTELRNAGLVRVRDWVKGAGQEYVLTPDGAGCVDDPVRLDRALAGTTRNSAPDPEPTTFERGEEAREAFLDPRPPQIVPAIVLANAFWFFVGVVLAMNQGKSAISYLVKADITQLQQLGAVSGFDLVRGEWWRLVSCAFNHGNILHLLLVAVAIVVLGILAESVWGSFRFLLLYLASAVGASCLEMAFHPAAFLVGASGAYCGIMCSLPVWLWFHRGHLPDRDVRRTFWLLGASILLSAAFSFIPGVSMLGHLGGGIAGTLVAFGFIWAKRIRRGGRWIALATVVIVTGGSVAGLIVQSRRGSDWQLLRLLEYARSRGEYEQSIARPLKPIQLMTVETIYRQAVNALHLGNAKPDFPKRVESLRDEATGFAAFVESQPRPRGRMAGLPAKYRAYALAVRDLADSILERLKDPEGSLATMEESRRVVQDRFKDLATID